MPDLSSSLFCFLPSRLFCRCCMLCKINLPLLVVDLVPGTTRQLPGFSISNPRVVCQSRARRKMRNSCAVTALLAVLLVFTGAVSAQTTTSKTAHISNTAAQRTLATFETTFMPFTTALAAEVTTTLNHPSADPTATGTRIDFPLVQNFDVEEGLSYLINTTADGLDNDVYLYCWYPISVSMAPFIFGHPLTGLRATGVCFLVVFST